MAKASTRDTNVAIGVDAWNQPSRNHWSTKGWMRPPGRSRAQFYPDRHLDTGTWRMGALVPHVRECATSVLGESMRRPAVTADDVYHLVTREELRSLPALPDAKEGRRCQHVAGNVRLKVRRGYVQVFWLEGVHDSPTSSHARSPRSTRSPRNAKANASC